MRQLTNATGTPPPPPVQITAAAAKPDDQGRYHWRRVRGVFQINIPVRAKERLLPKEELRLSIFRWIGGRIPNHDRWRPVFDRYLKLLGMKVADLGGNPAEIKPSWNGYDGLPEHRRPHRPGKERPSEREHRFTGKVEGIIYDHFGDFDGFVLELDDGTLHHFRSREPEVEQVVREAWRERIVTTVISEGTRSDHVRQLILKRPLRRRA